MWRILLLLFLAGCGVANNTNPVGPTGGVSVITYLQKQLDGVVFQETFENQNFVAADGWTIQRGTPANTQSQAVAGISSFDCTAGNQSMPIIYKTITDTNVALQNQGSWLAQVWFYDPITSTSAGALYTTSSTPGPYFKIGTTDGRFIQVGVRNSVSTNQYVLNANNNFTADNFAQTLGSRSNGWHLFSVTFNKFGHYFVGLDGAVASTQVNSTSAVTITPVSSIYICAGTSSDSGSSFGYFDNVGYFRNTQVTYTNFQGVIQANLYDKNNNYLQNTFGDFFQLANYSYLWPLPVYMEISNQGSTSSLSYRTPLTNINPGDIYQLQTINFGRKVTTYDPMIKELQSVNQSTAGVKETNSYGLKGPISFSVNSLTGWSWKQAADNFFLNAVQGNPFGLMVDNVSDNAFGVISTSAFGGTANTVQIGLNISGADAYHTTGPFTVGNYYYIRNNANTQKQLVNLTSMTTSTLIFDQNLNFNVFPLDYVYSLQLYPFLEVSGDTQTGFKCTDTKYPRFTWQQSCVDYNNG